MSSSKRGGSSTATASASAAAHKKSSATSKAKLILPVSRVRRLLRGKALRGRISPKAAVFLTSAMENVAAEVLREANDVMREAAGTKHAHKLVTSRDIFIGLGESKDLGAVFPRGIIPSSGATSFLLERLKGTTAEWNKKQKARAAKS